MRIRFLLHNAYAIGGTVRATLDSASVLADDHDVEIVTIFRHREEPRFPFDPRVPVRDLLRLDDQGPGDPYPQFDRRADRRHPGVDLAEAPSELFHPDDNKHDRYSLLTDARLEGFLRGLDDGVLVGTRPGLNLAMARWVGPGVFCVAQEHTYLEKHPRPLRRALRRYYPRLDAVTALTRHDVAAYREMLDDVPVHHMPNVMPDLPSAEVDLDRRVVVAGGRISHEKGFDLLVDAWGRVHPQHPDWELWIYGGGPRLPQLQEQVASSPATSSITLHGVTPDLPHKLPTGSVFVLSSRHEGFGLVLLEAMGHGLAVVSFDCEHGPGDIIDDDVDGLLVPPEDVGAMAEAIARVIGDRDLRHRLAAAAPDKTQRYSPAASRDRWDALLDRVGPDAGRSRRWLFGRPRW